MSWNDLSMKDKASYIRMGVENGITNLKIIRDTYNRYAKGGPLNPYSAGSLVDAIYRNSKGEEYLGEPSHHYDFTIPEEEANRLGYYPDERGHRDDRVKKPAHPTHPSRGKWNSFEEFELTDKGMENPNYTLFGLNDNNQDPQAVMTYKGEIVLPEITITPDKKYIHNPYDNINIYLDGYLGNKKSLGGNLYGDGGNKPRYKSSSNIRKQISTWEGATMKTNTPFDKMDTMFNQVLPAGALDKLSQEQLDGLYSFAYNVGTGRFKTRTAPTLAKYLQGNATIEDVKNTMWASGDKKYRGLANRRKKERSMLGAYVPVQEVIPMATPSITPMGITPAAQPIIESNPVIQDSIEAPLLASNIESQGESDYTPGFFDYVNYINQIRQPKQRDRRIWLTT